MCLIRTDIEAVIVVGKQTRIREEGCVCGGAELVDILRGGGRQGGREQGRGRGVRGDAAAAAEKAETSGVRRRGESEPVKILIKYSMVML